MKIDKKILNAAKITACRELFIRYKGKSHNKIEAEMREMGFTDFSRRMLYPRKSGRGKRDGWIAEFGLRTALAGNAAAPGCVPGDDFENFQSWLKRVSPNMTWDWRHQIYLYERLKLVTDGICKRLMIFMPPRHGKSELVTVRYTAWRMRRKPEMKVILASYGQQLANTFSRSIKRVLCDDAALGSGGDGERGSGGEEEKRSGGERERPRGGSGIRQDRSSSPPLLLSPSQHQPMFPFTSQRPVNTAAQWGTAVGGGLRAVGVGGGVTGFGADMIVIDDPVKNRAEAESETYRERVWSWYNDDLYTRLEPEGSIILIQTRWHEDDLAGRLLKQMNEGGEQWDVVDLPALAEEGETGARASCPPATGVASIPACEAGSSGLSGYGGTKLRGAGPRHAGGTGVGKQDACAPVEDHAARVPGDWRSPGDALCPERYDKPKLHDIRSQLGGYAFASLYQQHPTPADGAIFKKAWLRNIVESAPPGLRWFRGYDLAISTRTTADYTASFRVAVDDLGFMYIADGYRERIEYPEQRRFILERIRTERDTRHGIEDSVHGKAIVQDLRRDLRLMNYSFHGVPVVGDKLTRALNWSPLAESGKLKLVRGAWVNAFVGELIRFPMGNHDDQVDAVSVAVQMMAGMPDNKMYKF